MNLICHRIIKWIEMHMHMDVKLFMLINAYDYMYGLDNRFDNGNMKL